MSEIAVTVDFNAELVSLLSVSLKDTSTESSEEFSEFIYMSDDASAEVGKLFSTSGEDVDSFSALIPLNIKDKSDQLTSDQIGFFEPIDLELSSEEIAPIAAELDLQIENKIPGYKLSQDIGYIEAPSDSVLQLLKAEFKDEDLKFLANNKLTPVAEGPTKDLIREINLEKPIVSFTPAAQAKSSTVEVPKFIDIAQQVSKAENLEVENVQVSTNLSEDKNQNETQVLSTGLSKTTSGKFDIGEDKASVTLSKEIRLTPSEERENQKLTNDLMASTKTADLEVAGGKVAQAISSNMQQTYSSTQISQQVAFHMKEAIDKAQDKVTVQLNPPSLGKIEVELRFTDDGRVSAIINMDKQDTFDLLQRNPNQLKEALADAGFSSSNSDFTFNLNGQENSQEEKSRNPTQGLQAAGEELAQDITLYSANGTIDSSREVDIHA